MQDRTQWTNKSVLEFAQGDDPVARMEAKARELALTAMDDGWEGPPYDPIALARWKNLTVAARSDIPDARTVPLDDGNLILEYNPMRPRGRLRFSIAHEVAHTLFADCASEIRNRATYNEGPSDNWQLEVLCNIGAAELLMPMGSFKELAGRELSIASILALRKQFDTSMEACIIRMVKLSRISCAAFCVSRHSGGKYRVDYVIGSPGSLPPVGIGFEVPATSSVVEANAIGFTSVGEENWNGKRVRVECVGLAPYPGTLSPRVVGILINQDHSEFKPPQLKEVIGNALKPHGSGVKLIAHVIPNVKTLWGGGGFASQVRRHFPQVWQQFVEQTSADKGSLELGTILSGRVSEELQVVHMVAQRGIGPMGVQRLRTSALATSLSRLRAEARELDASVHMPRIGTGHGGANWDLVREIVMAELVDKGITTTVYSLAE